MFIILLLTSVDCELPLWQAHINTVVMINKIILLIFILTIPEIAFKIFTS